MDIDPRHLLRIAGAATGCVDEGASKTVTLPTAAGPADVDGVFRTAWEVGVKAVSGNRSPARRFFAIRFSGTTGSRMRCCATSSRHQPLPD